MEAYLGRTIPMKHRAINILTRAVGTSTIVRYTAFTSRDAVVELNKLLLEVRPDSNWRGDIVVLKHLPDNDFEFTNVTEADMDVILGCLRDVRI